MDGGAWWATAHGVAESRTRLSDQHTDVLCVVISIFISLHPSICLYLPVCPSASEFVHLSICGWTSIYICLSIHLSLYLTISTIHPSILYLNG